MIIAPRPASRTRGCTHPDFARSPVWFPIPPSSDVGDHPAIPLEGSKYQKCDMAVLRAGYSNFDMERSGRLGGKSAQSSSRWCVAAARRTSSHRLTEYCLHVGETGSLIRACEAF